MQEKLGHVICYREKSEGYKNKIRRIGCVIDVDPKGDSQVQ